MSTVSKSSAPTAPVSRQDKGVKVFTYPKLIFIFPTLLMSIVCWIGMLVIGDQTDPPSTRPVQGRTTAQPADPKATKAGDGKAPGSRTLSTDFKSPQNYLALLFLGVFAANILIMTFDFPRFTVVAGAFIITTIVFFLLWLTMVTDILPGLVHLLSGIYLAANAGFYLTFAIILTAMFGIVSLTRWLDYWEFLPNEILHHHGPWSDLERYPTMNLKFDKEIPDIFEYALFRSGRLIFHVATEQKSIFLNNVLDINRKEQKLKQLMSRLEVRVTTDQEVAQTP